MDEALLVWISAVIMLFVGVVNVALAVYTWTLLKSIRKLLEANTYLNTEAADLLHFWINRGYERGVNDTLKRVVEEGASLG
mgnify:CR=1 FL=1